MQLDHVGLSVRDLDAEAGFFGAAFGFQTEFPFTLGDTGIRGVMLRHPEGHRLELFAHPAPDPGLRAESPIAALGTLGYGHFALSATDIEPLFAAARAAGASALVPPGPSPEPGVRFAFLADPEGHLVELVERT